MKRLEIPKRFNLCTSTPGNVSRRIRKIETLETLGGFHQTESPPLLPVRSGAGKAGQRSAGLMSALPTPSGGAIDREAPAPKQAERLKRL